MLTQSVPKNNPLDLSSLRHKYPTRAKFLGEVIELDEETMQRIRQGRELSRRQHDEMLYRPRDHYKYSLGLDYYVNGVTDYARIGEAVWTMGYTLFNGIDHKGLVIPPVRDPNRRADMIMQVLSDSAAAGKITLTLQEICVVWQDVVTKCWFRPDDAKLQRHLRNLPYHDRLKTSAELRVERNFLSHLEKTGKVPSANMLVKMGSGQSTVRRILPRLLEKLSKLQRAAHVTGWSSVDVPRTDPLIDQLAAENSRLQQELEQLKALLFSSPVKGPDEPNPLLGKAQSRFDLPIDKERSKDLREVISDGSRNKEISSLSIGHATPPNPLLDKAQGSLGPSLTPIEQLRRDGACAVAKPKIPLCADEICTGCKKPVSSVIDSHGNVRWAEYSLAIPRRAQFNPTTMQPHECRRYRWDWSKEALADAAADRREQIELNWRARQRPRVYGAD